MAYGSNELAAQGSDIGPNLRVDAKTILPKTLAAEAGAALLPVLTPMAFNTSTNQWVVWTNAGVNGTGTISGFLWPDEAQLDASDEVLAQMLMEGKVHHDDVPVPSGETQGNLTTALKDVTLREKGIYIVGIDAVP